MRRVIPVMMALLLFLVTDAAANWLIFDVQGAARLVQGEKKTKLSLAKHLLKEVEPGTIVETAKNGKVVLVSQATNIAYEIGSSANVEVGETELVAAKGAFTQREGLAAPKKQSKLMAGVVMRGDERQQCLVIVQGSNTAVHTLTPTLTWQNRCDGSKIYLSLFSDEGLLMEFDSNRNGWTVPAETLNYGERYVWLLETSTGGQASAASFNTLTEAEVNRLAAVMTPNDADLAARLSTIFYLKDHRLNDLANEKLVALAGDYPDIDFRSTLEQ